MFYVNLKLGIRSVLYSLLLGPMFRFVKKKKTNVYSSVDESLVNSKEMYYLSLTTKYMQIIQYPFHFRDKTSFHKTHYITVLNVKNKKVALINELKV